MIINPIIPWRGGGGGGGQMSLFWANIADWFTRSIKSDKWRNVFMRGKLVKIMAVNN